MKLFKGARGSGKTAWLAKQIVNAPSGKHIYFITPNGLYLPILANRLDELGGYKGTLDVTAGEVQIMCGSLANEILREKDTCMVCIDELSAIISQCGENELKTLCRIISEVNEVYVTDTIPKTVKRQPRRGRIAEDYAALHQKMCDSQEKCVECPLWDADCKRCRDYGAVAGELLETVFQWTGKRPVKTRSQVFLEQNPNAKTENGIPIICPPSVDENEKCAGNSCRSCLDKYWNEEAAK